MLKNLYAPWRTEYAIETDKAKNEGATEKECTFCSIINQNNDEKHFIFRRFTFNYVMLNLYPYNAGHLLIIPFAHTDSLELVRKEARAELMELASASTQIIKNTLNAHGINLGLNLGKAAGAGIPSHVHMHVLPRWIGDTNFLPTLAETKQISVDLYKIYNELKPAFAQLQGI